ncbi:phosphate ABC transporter substrate-binding protein (PhoT family) [Parasphingopyxis lamellibrachiae]|uniref:Phosphate ABC transporter substrate-binding protein (PhoT family) n=1 Tax=Parasphingopyxis lamellibrachiae TaxID=680125 RepID=A0A3D9FG40_9SPHN|nr:phosphate ABC transporter substrate-binding protein (PhoT family) [Parasphingopyxis lamellibrachiae]
MRAPLISGLMTAMALTLAGCGGGGNDSGASAITVVGSSTVYPFTRAVAENFARNNPQFGSPVVESTGTGGGMELFCAGVGDEHPDVANASRRMKDSEFATCQENGVDQIIELQVGIDGLAVVESPEGPGMELTRAQIYEALAAEPYGEEQTAETWSDIDPSLPDTPIRVYGPPTTSGTRDAFIELIMEAGCEANPAMAALEEEDEDRKDRVCTAIREDQAFIEAGENDNLIIQRVAQNPGYLGLLGYSFLEQNEGQVVGVSIDGVAPTYDSIASFEYPGARPLFVYIKGNHLQAIRGLREFVAEYVSAWGPDGYLVEEGMIANPDDVRATNAASAEAMTALTAADFES